VHLGEEYNQEIDRDDRQRDLQLDPKDEIDKIKD
jgi:hypothetical protein